MKKVLLILAILIILAVIVVAGGLYWFMNPDLSAYEHLKDPQITTKADETVIMVSASGIPSEIAGDAISELFQAYYKVEGVDKSKMATPKARWEGEFTTDEDIITSSTLEGEFAITVPEGTPNSKIWTYGETAEILHVGSYASEPPTIKKLKDYITAQGYEIIGDHEEEYIKGPMWFLTGNEDKYQTVIRYNVVKKTSAWQTYTSQNGFSFQYPQAHTVVETVDPTNSQTYIIHIVAHNVPFPSAQITVGPMDVTFALWEGITWDYLDDVEDSFTREEEVKKYSELTNDEAMDMIVSPSQIAVVAMRDKNDTTLNESIHPTKGVRFSPYTYIDTTNDVVIKNLDFTSDKKYTWGNYDGRGNTIELTLDEYWDEFVFDKNFVQAEKIRNNEVVGTGNTTNNVLTTYDNAITVEYYYPGSDEYDQMDWASLRLSFEKYQDEWYLIGVTHDQWTI